MSIKDLIAAAKKSPGTLNYATSGNGSAPHFCAALFTQLAGVDMVHVPFKGGAESVQSVLAGDTQVTFATPPTVLSLVQSGRLRALAVTSRERSPFMPDIPGMAEAGLPAYDLTPWYGLFMPAGTPPAIVKTVFDAATKSVQQPEVKAVLQKEGTEVLLSKSPQDFADYLARDTTFWVQLVKQSGITVELNEHTASSAPAGRGDARPPFRRHGQDERASRLRRLSSSRRRTARSGAGPASPSPTA